MSVLGNENIFLGLPLRALVSFSVTAQEKAVFVYIYHTFGPFLEILVLPRELKWHNVKDFWNKSLWSFSPEKNCPHFLLKKASVMAEANFTLGQISKTIKFPF